MSDFGRKIVKAPTTSSDVGNIAQTSSTSHLSTAEYLPEPVEQYLSAHTQKVMQSIRKLEANYSPTVQTIVGTRATLEERLFDARVDVKVLLSQVSMHFSDELRKKLFAQLDLLHDLDDWDEEDDPIRVKSFKTFLRWFYLNSPARLPSFGLTSTGRFIASWLTNQNRDRLILEYLSNDRIKWFVTKFYTEEPDHSSGITSVSRAPAILAPYDIDAWFETRE